MELFQKFAAVEIQADNRISESDKQFCEKQQAAYETAVMAFKELSFFWEDMNTAQQKLLGSRDGPFFNDYLTSPNGPSISEHSIKKHIESLHREFIVNLVHYFNSTYHVTVSGHDVTSALFPGEPDCRRWDDKDAWEKYEVSLQSLNITYTKVVDQIIARLDGRSFTEQAFHELKTECHCAAWNTYRQEPEFERKKNVIRFTGYNCSCDSWYSTPHWELSEGYKKILRGAAHYETGNYNMFPLGFSDLLGYSKVETDSVEFSTCSKVKQLKMFKNRRVDLKFASEELAKEFIDTYLGNVC